MDWNLLIVGGIAILSSALTAFINHTFHTRQQEKRREWDIEDEQIRIKQDVIYQRLNQLELFIQNFGKKYTYYSYLFHEKITIKEIEDKKDEYPFLGDIRYYSYLFLYFDDKELVNSFEDLLTAHEKFQDLFKEFSSKIKNNENLDMNYYGNKVRVLHINKLFANVIKRIDYLKVKYRSV